MQLFVCFARGTITLRWPQQVFVFDNKFSIWLRKCKVKDTINCWQQQLQYFQQNDWIIMTIHLNTRKLLALVSSSHIRSTLILFLSCVKKVDENKSFSRLNIFKSSHSWWYASFYLSILSIGLAAFANACKQKTKTKIAIGWIVDRHQSFDEIHNCQTTNTFESLIV